MFRQIGNGVIVARLRRRHVEIGSFYLLRELLTQGFLDLNHVDVEQLGDNPHVDHVLDQLAQLGFRTHCGHQFVVRNGVEDEIIAQALQVQRLVVEHGRTRRQRQRIFLGGLRIHRNQEIDFLLTRNVAVFVGANRVPGGQARNVGGKKILARDRHAHLENAAQQYGVGTLRTGPVDRPDLDTHVIDDRLALEAAWGILKRYIGSSHPCPSFGVARMLTYKWGENPLLYGNAGEAHSRETRGKRRASGLQLGFHPVELRHVTKFIIS